MNATDELRTAVAWATHSLSFDLDRRVHVFELTIRALGSLLSAHALLLADPSLVPGRVLPFDADDMQALFCMRELLR